MIRSILKLGVLLVVGLVGYNFFFGDATEKAEAKETISKAKEVGKTLGKGLLTLAKDGVALVKKERAKFAEGKYDDAMENVSGLLGKMKDKVEGEGGEMLDRVKELEKARDALGIKLKDAKDDDGSISKEDKKTLKAEFDELMDETEKVLEKIDAKEGK